MLIQRRDYERHGWTETCPACRGLAANAITRGNHTEACRTRMETAIVGDEGGEERLERAQQRMAAQSEGAGPAPPDDRGGARQDRRPDEEEEEVVELVDSQ